MLETFRNKLNDWASASRPLLEIDSEVFPPADIDKLKRKLRIDIHAKEDGARNFPSKSSDTLSSTEHRINAEFIEISNEYIRQYRQQSDAYKDRYDEATRWWKMELISNEEKSLVNDVISEAKNKSGPVVSSQENLQNSAKQLLRFRESNDLMHRLPHIHDKWRQLLIVLLVFIVEFMVSVFLLREAGELSTLMVLVLVFVMLNSVFPIYIFGPTVRLMFFPWKQFSKKLIGIMGFTIFLIAGILLNFFIGHYRAAVMSFEVGEVSSLSAAFNQFERQQLLASEALNNFTDSILNLPDVWSWLMVAINLVLFFYAFYEGIVKDDYYPGYGHLTKLFRLAEDDYNDHIENAQVELNELRRDGIGEINLFKNQLRSSFNIAPRLVEKHQELDLSPELVPLAG